MARRSTAFLLAVGTWLACSSASAEQRGIVQPPSLRGVTKARTRAIHRARRQRVAPRVVARMVAEAARLDVNSAEFRKAVAVIPLRGRVDLFKALVEAQPGRQDAHAGLQVAKQAVETRQVAVDQAKAARGQATNETTRAAVREAETALRDAATALKTAETAYAPFEVKSFKRRLRGSLHIGKKRNNNETLLNVLESGGMSGKAQELVEAGFVKVNGEVVRSLVEDNKPVRVTKKDWVVVDVTTQYKEWKSPMKQSSTLNAEKIFFEVTPQTFELFGKVMGPNVAWFGGNRDPGHLHSVIADQGDRGKVHHNTYGTEYDAGSVPGNHTQYMMPLVLSDEAMDRNVRYQNAGYQAGQSHKTKVYGFYAGGKKITDIACTNWATAAPIGSLPRWVRRVDKKSRTLPGVPAKVRDKGLYMALAEAKDGKARHAIVDKVLAADGHTKWSYKAVKDLARRMGRELDDRLAPWVRQVDGMLKKLSREGAIAVPRMVAKEGLYKALEAAETREARQVIVDAVMAESNLPQLHDKTRRSVSELSQHFNGSHLGRKAVLKADFPARPSDLPLRQAMAKELGLSRSKDPAMWLTGLMLHRDTSVVAVFKGPEVFKPDMDFGMEIMGTVSAEGTMIRNAKVQAAYLKHPNKGAVAVPPQRGATVEATAAPEAGNE